MCSLKILKKRFEPTFNYSFMRSFSFFRVAIEDILFSSFRD